MSNLSRAQKVERRAWECMVCQTWLMYSARLSPPPFPFSPTCPPIRFPYKNFFFRRRKKKRGEGEKVSSNPSRSLSRSEIKARIEKKEKEDWFPSTHPSSPCFCVFRFFLKEDWKNFCCLFMPERSAKRSGRQQRTWFIIWKVSHFYSGNWRSPSTFPKASTQRGQFFKSISGSDGHESTRRSWKKILLKNRNFSWKYMSFASSLFFRA